MSQFQFSVGPWNVHEGADAFGPAVRKKIALEEKIARFKEIGFAAVQFHDDDAVPDINELSEQQIKEKARELKIVLNKYGMAAEFVAPRRPGIQRRQGFGRMPTISANACMTVLKNPASMRRWLNSKTEPGYRTIRAASIEEAAMSAGSGKFLSQPSTC